MSRPKSYAPRRMQSPRVARARCCGPCIRLTPARVVDEQKLSVRLLRMRALHDSVARDVRGAVV